MTKPLARGDWYEIRASAKSDDTTEVYVYGDIGPSWYGDSITAAQFVKDLQAIDTDNIAVRINSHGGSVTDGLAIHNALKRHRATVSTFVDGLAASCASLIAMAGETVTIAENALLMIHAPWSGVWGNATQMREAADLLDRFAKSMSVSYARNDFTAEAALSLLTDGEDHWYSAQEAKDAGLVDVIAEAVVVEASFNLSRFRSVPAAAAAFSTPGVKMTAKNPAAQQEPNTQQPAPTAPYARTKAESEEIVVAFKPFLASAGVHDLQTELLADPSVSPAAAGMRLLAMLGDDFESAAPRAGPVVQTSEDETDKYRAAAVDAIIARTALPFAKDHRARLQGNPMAGMTLTQLASAVLAHRSIKPKSHDPRDIVAAAFTQGTSDFPVILENVMHKVLQGSYAIAPDTWSRFCAVGSVSDFRAHNRYRLGSLSNLDEVGENGEFQNKAINDGEKSSIAAKTKGNIINITRQAIVNDDLGAFVGLAAMLGRAARRSIEQDVYDLLASNPTMADGVALFHANHGNLAGTGAAPTMTTIEAARIEMAKQKDISGNDFLDMRPAVALSGLVNGSAIRVAIEAQYDPDVVNKFQRPNIVKGLVRDVVDSPRIAGTSWYLFADPSVAPVLEVVFLNGVQEPYLEMEQGFDVDGVRYKVRLDYGVGAIDWRGAYRNAGS